VQLPSPCVECAPEGLWVFRRGGTTRCDCERGRILRSLDDARNRPALTNVEPVISVETAGSGVSILTALKYFPSEDGARIAIGNELRSMCNTGDEMLWLCARMVRLFTDWPGVPSLRAVFCAKFFPLDRETRGICPDYPDGIPAEIEQREPPRLLLPAGYAVSVDPSLEHSVRLLAQHTDMNRHLAESTAPRRPAATVPDVPVNPNFKPITQADIEKALDELRDQRARKALGLDDTQAT
jgi:hypothetical protein